MWSDACKSILFSLDGWMEYLSACLASVGQPCLSFSMTGRASGAKHTPCQPKGRWTGFWWSTAGCKCRGIKRGSVKRSIAVTGDQAAMAGWVSLLFFSCISEHGEQCWSMLKLSWFRSAHLVCPITMTGFDVHWIAFRFTLSCHFKILQMLLLVSSCTSDWTCLRSQPRYQKHRQVQLEESLALSRRLEEKGQDIRINRPFERMLLQFVFPHIFLWGSCFWFCIPPPPPPSPPPPPPPPSHSHNFVTHHISHTFSLTQLCHTPSHSHNFVTHHLSQLSYIQLCQTHTQLCHTSSFTHIWLSVDAVPFCVAGVALGDIHLRFAWQAWHLATSALVLRGRRGTWGNVWRTVWCREKMLVCFWIWYNKWFDTMCKESCVAVKNIFASKERAVASAVRCCQVFSVWR